MHACGPAFFAAAVAGGGTPENLLGSGTPGSQTLFDFTSELGMRFQSDVDGTITKIRFYCASNHVTNGGSVSIWNAGGSRLVEETFGTPGLDAWYEHTLASPLHISASTVYTASRNNTSGAFYAPPNLTPPLNNGSHLSIPGSGVNGVFGTNDTFPAGDGTGQNYHVDIEFVPD